MLNQTRHFKTVILTHTMDICNMYIIISMSIPADSSFTIQNNSKNDIFFLVIKSFVQQMKNPMKKQFRPPIKFCKLSQKKKIQNTKDKITILFFRWKQNQQKATIYIHISITLKEKSEKHGKFIQVNDVVHINISTF